ncbi:unnamed protein product [Chondrus crispus]|uniref:Uncharacterized protein n=1 Tax=Chondrus crispus TaxID=2769 RepID=R7QHW8_CHOCR|nr:unnamed protein product [Chondrus crispus]CDF38112.1 unnamed protein product [Chondrus crispus]|eukprot:XP_005717981.1 unnamed protein product [Chondrus crispus]
MHLPNQPFSPTSPSPCRQPLHPNRHDDPLLRPLHPRPHLSRAPAEPLPHGAPSPAARATSGPGPDPGRAAGRGRARQRAAARLRAEAGGDVRAARLRDGAAAQLGGRDELHRRGRRRRPDAGARGRRAGAGQRRRGLYRRVPGVRAERPQGTRDAARRAQGEECHADDRTRNLWRGGG